MINKNEKKMSKNSEKLKKNRSFIYKKIKNI